MTKHNISDNERTNFIVMRARERFRSIKPQKTQQKVQEFNKYREMGSYHWDGLERSIRRYNAPLAARYTLSEEMIKKNCRNPGCIVDIGCGDGVFTKRLAEIYRDSKVIGFDFDDTAIELARKKTKGLKLPNLSYHKGDAFEHKSSADLIVATDVIEHLNKPDVFLATCYDTLRSDGKLFISTPIRFREHSTDPYHVHEFFYDELEAFSMLFDFSIIEHLYSHDYLHNEAYNKKFSISKVDKKRYYYKFFYNLLAIYFGKNVFERQNSALPIMQYILLGKA